MSLPIRPPVIVNHMGAFDPGNHPNSVEAMRACLDAKASFVETDITALADGDYLLVHDPALESETTGTGPVGQCTSAQARGLFFKPGKTDKGQFHVPLLSQVVALFQDYPSGARLQLDFKNMYPFPDDAPLHNLIKLIQPLGDRVLVSTGADWQLRKLRTLAPWLDLGLDVHFYIDLRDPEDEGAEVYPRHLGAYGYWDDHPLASQRIWTTADYLKDKCQTLMGLVPRTSTFYISHWLLIKSLDDGFNWADELHKGGIKLDAWTLDSDSPDAVAHAKRLLAAGVDQFTTNTPTAMAELLSQSQAKNEV